MPGLETGSNLKLSLKFVRRLQIQILFTKSFLKLRTKCSNGFRF